MKSSAIREIEDFLGKTWQEKENVASSNERSPRSETYLNYHGEDIEDDKAIGNGGEEEEEEEDDNEEVDLENLVEWFESLTGFKKVIEKEERKRRETESQTVRTKVSGSSERVRKKVCNEEAEEAKEKEWPENDDYMSYTCDSCMWTIQEPKCEEFLKHCNSMVHKEQMKNRFWKDNGGKKPPFTRNEKHFRFGKIPFDESNMDSSKKKLFEEFLKYLNSTEGNEFENLTSAPGTGENRKGKFKRKLYNDWQDFCWQGRQNQNHLQDNQMKRKQFYQNGRPDKRSQSFNQIQCFHQEEDDSFSQNQHQPQGKYKPQNHNHCCQSQKNWQKNFQQNCNQTQSQPQQQKSCQQQVGLDFQKQSCQCQKSNPQQNRSQQKKFNPQQNKSQQQKSNPQKNKSQQQKFIPQQNTNQQQKFNPQQNTNQQQKFNPEQNTSQQQKFNPQQNTNQQQKFNPQQNTSQVQKSNPQQNTNQQQKFNPQQNTSQVQKSNPQQNTSQQQKFNPQQNTSQQQKSNHLSSKEQEQNKNSQVENPPFRQPQSKSNHQTSNNSQNVYKNYNFQPEELNKGHQGQLQQLHMKKKSELQNCQQRAVQSIKMNTDQNNTIKNDNHKKPQKQNCSCADQTRGNEKKCQNGYKSLSTKPKKADCIMS